MILRILLALIMSGAGVYHLVAPQLFVPAIPAFLPHPRALVIVSGLFEIAGGVGLLIPALRRFAAYGLIALYIAVFPANVNMALHPEAWPALTPLFLWLRLPFQILFIAWAWWVRPPPRTTGGE